MARRGCPDGTSGLCVLLRKNGTAVPLRLGLQSSSGHPNNDKIVASNARWPARSRDSFQIERLSIARADSRLTERQYFAVQAEMAVAGGIPYVNSGERPCSDPGYQPSRENQARQSKPGQPQRSRF